jgi:hypothetical protein
LKMIEHETTEVLHELRRTEEEIRSHLAEQVGLKVGDLDFRTRPIPRVVLHVPTTPSQLAALQSFLDHYGRHPRNVRIPRGLN